MCLFWTQLRVRHRGTDRNKPCFLLPTSFYSSRDSQSSRHPSRPLKGREDLSPGRSGTGPPPPHPYPHSHPQQRRLMTGGKGGESPGNDREGRREMAGPGDPLGGLGWYSVPYFPLGSLQEEQWPGCFLPECLSCGQGRRGGGGSAQQRGILLDTTQNQWRLVCPAAWGVARHAGEGTWAAGWERRVLGCASLEHCSGPRLATPLSSSSFKKKKKKVWGRVLPENTQAHLHLQGEPLGSETVTFPGRNWTS